MGEHQSTFRILGASAAEVLQTIVGQLPATARVALGQPLGQGDGQFPAAELPARPRGCGAVGGFPRDAPRQRGA